MTDPPSPGRQEFAVYPAELASAARRIQGSVADLPAALHRFARDGLANPSEFGSTAQDQQVGQRYQALCDAVQELLPATQDGINSLGATILRWAEIFVDHDAATGASIMRGIAHQPEQPR